MFNTFIVGMGSFGWMEELSSIWNEESSAGADVLFVWIVAK